MYKALESFTTKNYDVRRGQILAGDFTTQDEITEFLNIGYIEEYDGSLEISENGTYDVSDYEQAVVNVSGGGENNVLVDTSLLYNTGYGLLSLIKSVSEIDTSNMTTVASLFVACSHLVDVPVLNLAKVTNVYAMFQNCNSLSDESLNNILASCITANSYTGVKTLARLGLTNTYYPVSRIEALPNYQAFLNAGWTIGY